MAKWMDKTSAISAAVSAICALIAVVSTYNTCSRVSPNIEYYFDQPPEGGNPVFLAINTGDIPLRSFSVSHNFYVFSREKKKIVSHGTQQHFLSNRAIFLEKFKPNEKANASLVEINYNPNRVAIYKFNILYYVGETMKKYEDELIYFIKDKKPFNHSSFINDKDYRQMVHDLDVVDAEIKGIKIDPGRLKQAIELMDKK